MNKAEYIESEHGYLPRRAQHALLSLPGRVEFLLASIGPAPRRILDVGCATGYITLLLKRLGHEVTGIELNTLMVSEARALGADVLQHDLEQPLPLPDGSFDVVHACEVIEHLFDTQGLLTELHRVLVPGGLMILSTPNLNSFANRFRVLFGLSLPMWGAFPKDHHGSHVRVFNKAKIVLLLRMTGFEPQSFRGINQSRLTKVLDGFPTLSELLLVKALRC